jgi:ATP-dependent DNA helicase RecQ
MSYGMADVVQRRRMIAEGNAPAEIKRIENTKLNALLNICESTACRRQSILAHFGETYPGNCGNCDACLAPADTWDGTDAAVKAMSAIYRTGQTFGAGYVIDVIVGKSTERTQNFGHERLPVFGVGQDTEPRVWQSVIRQLTASGLIVVDPQFGALKLSEDARAVFRGERTITLRRDLPARKTKKEARAAKTAVMPEEAQGLFQQLRALRAKLAKAQGVPPYVVFHDTTLRAMAEARPTTLDAMGGITGVGKAKLDRYGADFLQVVQASA